MDSCGWSRMGVYNLGKFFKKEKERIKMIKTTTLEELVKQLDQEELMMLVHGYDHHVMSCGRESQTPLSLLAYYQTDDYQDLVESGDIYDLMEYESDMEEASLEELMQLAIVFNDCVQEEIQTGAEVFTCLTCLIDELEVGLNLTEEEKALSQLFDERLAQYGYLPTDDGRLVHATPEEQEDLNPTYFIWDDYPLVKELLQRHPDQIHVCTLIDGGRRMVATEGWHFVNRIGYYLSSQPLLGPNEEVVL